MGGGLSRTTSSRDATSAVSSSFLQPSTNGSVKTFIVTATEVLLKQAKRDETLLFEVSTEGFRLLKLETKDPIGAFPWNQVHSWRHVGPTFSFRYYDDRSKAVVEHAMHADDVLGVLKHIQRTVTTILGQRKEQAIPEQEYNELSSMVSNVTEDLRLQHLQTAASMNFFTSVQAHGLVCLLQNSFDRVEAALLMHSRLIDQSNFPHVLSALDCDADRDNVWVRITDLKRQSSTLLPKSPSSPKSAFDRLYSENSSSFVM